MKEEYVPERTKREGVDALTNRRNLRGHGRNHRTSSKEGEEKIKRQYVGGSR